MSNSPQTREQEHHWADQAASDLIRAKPDQELFTLASGITPSGTVHIGNFRELITVDLVRRALVRKGKKTRFLFSWDDYDVFRKVPANMPKQEVLATYLGKPIVKTPDPFGKEESYARHHEVAMETSIRRVGVAPEFLYQEKNYRGSRYASQIREALLGREKIAAILNEFRKEPLGPEWSPASVFCGKCDKDDTVVKGFDGEWTLSYACSACGHAESVDLRTTGLVKLLWRVDWPMRWAFEKVDFEPGGKDHSSDGGSFDTAKTIVKTLWNREAPKYLMYDFIRIKGRGGKISSSKGEVITLDDLLEIYEPAMARWLFASYRPGVEFAISFDLDVVKLYEDWDRLERRVYGLEPSPDKDREHFKRIYELAQVSEGPLPEKPAFAPAFRHLTSLLQVHDLDVERTKAHYAADLKTPADTARFELRARCAVAWLRDHAPEDFRFAIRAEKKLPDLEPAYAQALAALADVLRKSEKLEEESLATEVQAIIKSRELEMPRFFAACYQALIGKDKGPKLAGFLVAMGKERALSLLG